MLGSLITDYPPIARRGALWGALVAIVAVTIAISVPPKTPGENPRFRLLATSSS